MKKEITISPPQAPTAAELLARPEVQAALQQAWVDSLPGDAVNRHEEGGWIYMEPTTGQIAVQRASSGLRAALDLGNPPLIPGSVVVATFHTHPNPTAEGYFGGPSGFDELSADALGVPCLIRADDGDHTAGPERRRGGLTGNPGLPA